MPTPCAKASIAFYDRLKRNKALPDIQGLGVAVLDGHETSASYLRCCPGCLQRSIHLIAGDRIQCYHRNVTLMLVSADTPFTVSKVSPRCKPAR